MYGVWAASTAETFEFCAMPQPSRIIKSTFLFIGRKNWRGKYNGDLWDLGQLMKKSVQVQEGIKKIGQIIVLTVLWHNFGLSLTL
jgi:hypothetical protein